MGTTGFSTRYLTLDSERLGKMSELRAHAPAVDGLQNSADVDLSHVLVPANQGLFVIVQSGGEGGS